MLNPQASDQRLNAEQFEALLDALLDAFPSVSDLRMLVRLKLDTNLSVIAGGNNLREVAFDLVQWADVNGKVDALLTGAGAQNPGNRKLRRLREQWAASQEPPHGQSPQSPSPSTNRSYAYLSRSTCDALIAAAQGAGMLTFDVRDYLLSGIAAGFAASLPRKNNILLQFLSDLNELNTVRALEDGEVPLRIWLENGLHWLEQTGRTEQEQFRQALQELAKGAQHG